VLSRSLSVNEMKLLDQYPEIQADPKKVLEMLATALSTSQEGNLLPPGEAT
jgi:hypothetical protein